jgi:hypothetical protein
MMNCSVLTVLIIICFAQSVHSVTKESSCRVKLDDGTIIDLSEIDNVNKPMLVVVFFFSEN